MKYEIMNRSDASWSTDTKDAPYTAIISITDIDTDKNTFMIRPWIKGILELQFEDVYMGEPYCITTEQAAEIAKFALGMYDRVKRFIIHCEFGRSRSAGTAAALSEYFEGDDDGIFGNKLYLPNPACYVSVYNALIKIRPKAGLTEKTYETYQEIKKPRKLRGGWPLKFFT